MTRPSVRSVLVAGTVAALAAALGTHRAWADGPAPPFALSVVAGAAAGVLLWVQGVQQDRPAWAQRLWCSAGIAAALMAPALHTARFINRGAVVEARLTEPIAYGAVLVPTLKGSATLHLDDGAVVLRVPAGSEGSLDVKRPALEALRWELPRALLVPDAPAAREVLTWSAAIERDNTYFVLLDAEPLLVQLTPASVYVSIPSTAGRMTEAHAPIAGGRSMQAEWQVEQHGGRATLRMNDRVIWSGELGRPLRHMRLGETRTDLEHGGTMRLTALRYARQLDA